MIKVMLVDDESMVLDDTMRMIDWEQNGFVVVGALTNAQAAWELYQRERPQIVIADICMPVMDGLALSERIFSTGDMVQVLLLSSHESFQYAKSAIELGIGRYLLKHELDAQILLQELRHASNVLEEKWQARQLAKQQTLRCMLAGDVDTTDKGDFLAAHDYWLLAFSERRTNHPLLTDHSLRITLQERDYLCLDAVAVALEEGSLAFLLPLAIHADGHIEDADKQLKKVSAVMEGHGLENPMLFYEVLCMPGGTQFHEQYSLWRQLYRHAVFFDDSAHNRYQLRQLAGQCVDEPVAKHQLQPLLEGMELAADRQDIEMLLHLLDELFAQCRRKPWNYRFVSWLSIHLDRLCARCSQQIEAATPAEQITDRGEEEEQWGNLTEMHAYYASQLYDLLEQRQFLVSSSYSRNLVLAIQYIHKHYNDDLSLDRVAAATEISGVYLSQLFKRETGQTFIEYLTALRIEKSKKLLREGTHKIYQVSAMVGFNSNQYFSQVFRRATGLSPVDYRDSRR